MVGQREWAWNLCLRRKKKSQRRLRYSVLLDMPIEVSYLLLKKVRKARQEIERFMQRRRHVAETSFNFNIFSTLDCLRLFRFRPNDMGHVISFISFPGRTVRRGYVCSEITAACILLRRISYPSRWYELEYLFGMSCGKMSEIFWESCERVYNQHSSLISPFRSALMASRAHMYAQNIRGAGAMLPRCVGFIDVTKVLICRPGGPNQIQQSVYSGHKRVHCLLFCTVTTPDGLIFFATALLKDEDMICLCWNILGWTMHLAKAFSFPENSTTCMVIQPTWITSDHGY